MSSDVERLGRSKYVLVTTFRRNGTPVSTPVWAGRDGDELVVWTQTTTGKVKRVRNNPEVELTECDLRGRPRGTAVKGTARILDQEGTERGRRVLRKKYGVLGRVMIGASKLIRGTDATLCLAISVQPPSTTPPAE